MQITINLLNKKLEVKSDNYVQASQENSQLRKNLAHQKAAFSDKIRALQ